AQLAKGTPQVRQHQIFSLTNYLVGATPFLLAAKFAEVGMMRVLGAAGADTRLAHEDGTTPLMEAAGMDWGRNEVASGEDRRGRERYTPTSLKEDEAQALDAVKAALD